MHINFSLGFQVIRIDNLKDLLKNANCSSNEIERINVKRIADLFLIHEEPISELQEFQSRGMELYIRDLGK